MNEPKKTRPSKKHCWSIARKAAFYSSVTSFLLTIGAFAYALITHEHSLSHALYFISQPAHCMCNLFGYDTLAYHDWFGADLVGWMVLPTLANALLFFLISLPTLFLISKFNKNANNGSSI